MIGNVTTHEVVAEWRGYRYVAPQWVSEDGDEWFDSDEGDHAHGKDFDTARIRLVGGPRDGEVVS